MASGRRSCKNKPYVFCYICGEYTLIANRYPVTNFVKRAYHSYFGMKLGDQDKLWAPHMICKTCIEHLRQWTKGTRSSLKFGIPMVWREPSNHATDCYFCAISLTGINKKNILIWIDALGAESRAHFDALAALLSRRRHRVRGRTRAWCAGSTTTTARCSSGSPTGSARRARSPAAAATTACSSRSAASRRPRAASRSASSA